MKFNSKICIRYGDIQRTISKDSPVFIVSEIGINHNGNLSLAKECIAASASAGADAVKFQNYNINDFIIDDKIYLTYYSNGKKKVESERKMFKRCQFSFSQYVELNEFAKKEGIILFSTPSGTSGLEDIQKLGLPIIKNASDSLINHTLVKKMGESKKSIILSTGMSTLSEIDEAVRIFSETKNKNLILLVCTSNYPTKPENVNLLRIKTLSNCFGCMVGFSDHTEGNYAAVGATIMGAVYIEKHFTLNKRLSGPDHWFSLNPIELEDYVKSIRNIEKSVGTGYINFEKSELKSRRNFLLTLTFNKNIKKGEIITENDIIFARPGIGIPPKYIYYFLGKKLYRNVYKGEKLKFEMIIP